MSCFGELKRISLSAYKHDINYFHKLSQTVSQTILLSRLDQISSSKQAICYVIWCELSCRMQALFYNNMEFWSLYFLPFGFQLKLFCDFWNGLCNMLNYSASCCKDFVKCCLIECIWVTPIWKCNSFGS